MEKNHCSIGILVDDTGMTAGNQLYWRRIQDYLRVLKDISPRLGEAADQGELEVMADLVSQRQLIINHWAKLSLPGDVPSAPPKIENDLRELLTKGKNLINHLTVWRAAVLERLKSLDQGQRLLNTYKNVGTKQPRFLNLQH